MKKMFILVCAFAALFTASAQTEKGSRLIGVSLGSISFTNSNSQTNYSNTTTVYKSEGNSFSISVNPNIGWFIQDRLAVGAGVSASFYNSSSKSSNSASTSTTKSTSTQPSFYVGPFARYYFSGSKTGMPFVQANAQYGIYGGKSKSETSTGSSSETTTKPKYDWNAGLTFGYEHFITSSIGFYASIGFNYGSTKTMYEYRPSTGTGYDYTSSYKRFYVPVNVGFQAHLPKRK